MVLVVGEWSMAGVPKSVRTEEDKSKIGEKVLLGGEEGLEALKVAIEILSSTTMLFVGD